MLTTAGSTRLTIAENELEEGIGSGKASGAALVPAKEKLCIAETLPFSSVPIKIPATRVAPIDTVAISFRRRVQATIFLDCSIEIAPIYSVAQCTCREYNTLKGPGFLSIFDAPRR